MERRSLNIVLPVLMGLVVTTYALIAFDGEAAFYRLWYYVPAAITAGSLIANRISRSHQTKAGWMLDIIVASVCLARPLCGWPPVSGHAIFSVYSLISGNDIATRVLSIILLLITLYAKIYLWHWDATLWPGLILGTFGGFLHWWLSRRSSVSHFG